jgi:DNA-directed RNA polymerase specialized sigma subunit
VDTPHLDALIAEINALVSERNELQMRLDDIEQAEDSNKKKLSDREVKEIRNLNKASHLTQREIADIYDINPSTVSRIVRGMYWK